MIFHFCLPQQELPCVGGVLDDSTGSGIWNARLAGFGSDPPGKEWRCVRNLVGTVVRSFSLLWSPLNFYDSIL